MFTDYYSEKKNFIDFSKKCYYYMLLTTFNMKFNTAVPPPRITDRNVLKDPRIKLIFPLTILQIDSSNDNSVPIFCLAKSMIAPKLNISKNKKDIHNN